MGIPDRGVDFLEGASQVHGAGLPAHFGLPRDGAAQGPVHLAHAGTVAEPGKPPAVIFREIEPPDVQELARRDVEEVIIRPRQIAQRADGDAGPDLSPLSPEAIRQRIGELLGAAFDNRPPHAVGQHGQEDSEGGRCGLVQGDHGVGRKPREEGARPRAPELRFREISGRAEGLQSETGHEYRVFGQREGLEDIRKEPLVILHEGLKHLPVGPAVGAEHLGRCLERSVKAQGLPVPEGVGQRDFGMDPFEAVAMKLELPEKGG